MDTLDIEHRQLKLDVILVASWPISSAENHLQQRMTQYLLAVVLSDGRLHRHKLYRLQPLTVLSAEDLPSDIDKILAFADCKQYLLGYRSADQLADN